MNQWDKLASQYGANLIAQAYILMPFLAGLKERFSNQKILDVGCGNGFYSKFFSEAPAHVIGIDPAEEQIKLAQELFPDLEFQVNSFEEFNGGVFDILFANMVVCNLQSLAEFVQAASRHADIGTQFYITNVAAEFQQSCDVYGLKHEYPEDIEDGGKFEVSLQAIDGSYIGPFANYHWSLQALREAFETEGWRLKSQKEFSGTADGEELPTYVLYVFEKV
jgi:SAM-dependent methyltransferase